MLQIAMILTWLVLVFLHFSKHRSGQTIKSISRQMKESSRQLVQEDRHWLQNGWIPTIHGHNCIAEGPTGSVLLLVVVATIVMMVLTNERNIQQASMVLLWAVRHKDTSPIQDDFLLQYVFFLRGRFSIPVHRKRVIEKVIYIVIFTKDGSYQCINAGTYKIVLRLHRCVYQGWRWRKRRTTTSNCGTLPHGMVI